MEDIASVLGVAVFIGTIFAFVLTVYFIKLTRNLNKLAKTLTLEIAKKNEKDGEPT